MKKTYTCVVCPEGCSITAETDGDGGVLSVTGNKCKRGEAYVRQEAVDPMRNISSTVKLTGGERPVFPVKTSCPIPKGKIRAVMEEIIRASAIAPVRAGQIIIKNAAGTNGDIVASSDAR